MEPLKVGDVVRRKSIIPSSMIGRIVRFEMQGTVALAMVEWLNDPPVMNPTPTPVESLERVRLPE